MASVLVLYLVIISTALIVLGFIRFSQKCVIYIQIPLNQQEFQEIGNKNQGSEYSGNYDANYNKVQFTEDNEFDLSGVDMSEAITEFINMLDIDNKSEVAKYTTELYNRSVDRPK